MERYEFVLITVEDTDRDCNGYYAVIVCEFVDKQVFGPTEEERQEVVKEVREGEKGRSEDQFATPPTARHLDRNCTADGLTKEDNPVTMDP